MTAVSAPAPSAVTDTFPINGTDYVEFWVGNASGRLLHSIAWGSAHRLPRTGDRHPRPGQLRARAGQDPLRADHGPGPARARWPSTCTVTATACVTSRSGWTMRAMRSRAPGARCEARPGADGARGRAREGHDRGHPDLRRHDPFPRGAEGLPGPLPPRVPAHQSMIAPGRRSPVRGSLRRQRRARQDERVGAFYRDVLGFKLMRFDDKDISTEYSALMSKVMANGNLRIKFPINEPAEGKKKPDRRVPGVLPRRRRAARRHRDQRHHRVGDAAAAGASSSSGCPASYYDTVLDRVGKIDEAMEPLSGTRHPGGPRRRGLPAPDLHPAGQDRPTLFYEIIQRKGAKSFGKGNFKALFEAIEREQAARGNL